MAQSRPHIPLPAKLDLQENLAVTWKRFKRNWLNYEIAARLGLGKEDEKYKCAILLSCIGDEALEIYDGFSIDKESETVQEILQRFEKHCVGETNEIYETFVFHQRQQQAEESIDSYLTALRKLAKSCNFGEMENRMIRDRIVLGVRDDNIRKKLLEDRNLTLNSCLDLVRAHEASVKQVKTIGRNGTHNDDDDIDVTVDRLANKHVNDLMHGNHRPTNRSRFRSRPNMTGDCIKCGRSHTNPKEECPAKGTVCNNCGKRNHWAAVCRSQHRVQEVTEAIEEIFFIGEITSANKSRPWNMDLEMEGTKLSFKLDTGADVTVIPPGKVPKAVKVQKSQKRLSAPGKHEVTVLGEFSAQIRKGDKLTIQTVYVIKDLQEALLGRPAIVALDLIRFVQSVSDEHDERSKHPHLFNRLGKTSKAYTIRLKEKPVPQAVTVPRRVPLPYKDQVKEELDRLKTQGVIRPVTTPTDWCAPIVVVPKANSNKIRICVDLTKLNESVQRENFPLPATDQLLAEMNGSTIFSKLDCNSGFYQIPLTEQCQELTTFITPFGRYCFTRLPFGISSGSEVFHRMMAQLLEGIPGVICNIDDILVHAKSMKEHDTSLEEVLKRLEREGVTLNDKCLFRQERLTFLGHVISKHGVEMDPDKVEAIRAIPRPTNLEELRRMLGIVNYVSKFAPHLANTEKPLRDLLKKDADWIWDSPQEAAFQQIKEQLSSPPVLAHYCASLPTKVSADASSYGLGAVLMQKHDNDWRPVFFASRSMTMTEERYAQVEKEALAMTWACERFSDFLLGIPSFEIETDHRPLLALMKTKSLDELTPRIQRFRMRMMRYQYFVTYKPGKNLITADALSRAPARRPDSRDKTLEEDVSSFVNMIVENLPASKSKLDEIRQAQRKDTISSQLREFCMKGWPDKAKSNDKLRPYFKERQDLTIQDDLLMWRDRIFIPDSMRKTILDKIHEGHQGIEKCRMFARQSVWWPGISKEIYSLVENCPVCLKERRNRPEPLRTTPVPEYPWQRVATDIFDFKGRQYLLMTDYFSKFVEVAHLSATTSHSVIEHCKSIFARHGIPEVLVSDNGPQYASKQFAQFAASYGFQHVTSSPRYPQANGEAERQIQTVKNILKKASDPYVALLNFRATPLQCGFSPAERLMGRKLRTQVPASKQQKIPDWPALDKMKEQSELLKAKQRTNFARSHKAKPLDPLHQGDTVWIQTPNIHPGVIQEEVSPRSYIIQTDGGSQRRNRRQLTKRHNTPLVLGTNHPMATSTVPLPPLELEHDVLPLIPEEEEERETAPVSTDSGREVNPPETAPVFTSSGRKVNPPDRLDI